MDTASQPYSYASHKPNYFTFTTDRGAEYECYFISAADYFAAYPDIASKVFMFGIDLVSKPVMKGIDYRIQFTVVDIVANFLSSKSTPSFMSATPLTAVTPPGSKNSRVGIFMPNTPRDRLRRL